MYIFIVHPLQSLKKDKYLRIYVFKILKKNSYN